MSFLNPQGQDYLPREISQHTRQGFRQMYNGTDLGGITLNLTLAEGAWESIGPTGSGADNIWAAMDVIPSDATAIIIRTEADLAGAGGANTNVQAYARAVGALEGDIRNNRILNFRYDNTTGGAGDQSGISENVVPLDANNRFEMNWAAAFESSVFIYLEYAGFICEEIPPLEAPVIDSVNDIEHEVSNGFKDGLNLSGGQVDESLTEFTVTHFSSSDQAFGLGHPTFPGGTWTAYTQNPSDEGIEWDAAAQENGPLAQPTAAGPYIGAGPYNQSGSPMVEEIPGGGGRWKRVQVTVKNAAGEDTDFVFIKMEGF